MILAFTIHGRIWFTPNRTAETANPQANPLYEVRHLRRALRRLEETHATTSPVIANLKRIVVSPICELEAKLGGTDLFDALTIQRNT
jgi:hypothetical protein